MTERFPEDEPVIAALHYATLALMQRLRPDVLAPLEGKPPETTGYGFPPDWSWEPGGTPRANLRRARFLLDLALSDDQDVILEDGFPSQSAISEWARQFPNTVLIQALQLVEEVGEIARAIVKREQGIRGTHDEWTEEIKKELGDAFISLTNLSDQAGFDLATVATLRWIGKVSKRNFVTDPQGHGLPETG